MCVCVCVCVCVLFSFIFWSFHYGTAEMNPTGNHEVVDLIPGLASGLGIRHYPELWNSSQTWLRSNVAVAVV